MDLYISVLDIVSIAVVLVLDAIYIYTYTQKTHLHENSTPLRKNLENVVYWSLKHFKASHDTPTTTLAVQTLRNSMIAAIFIGGSALTAAGAVIQPMYEYWTPRLAVRQIVLASLLCVSFLNWALVIRYNTHAGFMAGAIHTHVKEKISEMRLEKLRESRKTERGVSEDGVGAVESEDIDLENQSLIDQESEECAREAVGKDFTKICTLSVLHQAWGFRFIFFAIPFFFYSAGPVALLISGVLMNIFLIFFHDYPMAFSTEEQMPTKVSYRLIPMKSI